jgi:hypothetical protein
MAFASVPTHGKLGALYVLRPNGFSGVGLNDVTWGTGATNAATAYYEVVIDSELGGTAGVDTFKWRKNGGAWTENVDVTGAAQTLDEAQTITFAATTGHTLTDQWVIGNLKTEGTTESTNTAQITTAGNRMINPNAPPTWTDSGGKVVLQTNFSNGSAIFSDNVGTVTVSGNNGYVPAAALKKVGYLLDWTLNLTLDMADASYMGAAWKEALPGQAGGNGSANALFVANQTLLNCLAESIAAGDKYFLLELFTWDASQDQTGDHITAWVTFDSFAVPNSFNQVVKESVNFQVYGAVSITAQT